MLLAIAAAVTATKLVAVDMWRTVTRQVTRATVGELFVVTVTRLSGIVG